MSARIPEEVMPLVEESLKREIAFLEAKISLMQKEISQLEKKYNLTSKKFEPKFDKGELGDEQDYFEWWGLVQGLKKLEHNLKLSKSVIFS